MQQVLIEDGKARGVVLEDGSKILSDVVISNCTPHHTFVDLVDSSALPSSFLHHIKHADYKCGSFKINVALKGLPDFICCPSSSDGKPGPQHRGTIHFENRMEEIEEAFRDADRRKPANRPVIEMTIPSSLDKTISPEGFHVASIFVQFAPYDIDPAVGSWSDLKFKEGFVKRVFSIIDEYAPNFSDLVVNYDALSPLDLENIFGLTGGSISHGSMALHQLLHSRPHPLYNNYTTPIENMYLCGAGTHPGGGVMGAAGRNCSKVVIQQTERK